MLHAYQQPKPNLLWSISLLASHSSTARPAPQHLKISMTTSSSCQHYPQSRSQSIKSKAYIVSSIDSRAKLSDDIGKDRSHIAKSSSSMSSCSSSSSSFRPDAFPYNPIPAYLWPPRAVSESCLVREDASERTPGYSYALNLATQVLKRFSCN